jgi:hypothetical protein
MTTTHDYRVIYASSGEVELHQVGTATRFEGQQLNLSGTDVDECQLKAGQIVRITIEVQEGD